MIGVLSFEVVQKRHRHPSSRTLILRAVARAKDSMNVVVLVYDAYPFHVFD